jgi:ribose/xylose/arabinose/galactoside ABC-type transport system permease subunit
MAIFSTPDSPAGTQPDSADVASAGAVQGGRAVKERGPVITFFEHYGLLALLVVVVVFFCVYPPTSAEFFSRANLITMLGNQTVVATIALAALIPLASGYIDLSVAAIAGMSSCTFATLLTRVHLPLVVSILLGVLVGALLGAVNGLLIARYHLSSIIVTLGSQIALGGVMEWYTKNNTIGAGMSQGIITFGSSNWLGIPRLTWIFLPVILIVWFLLEQTPFGRYIQAISSNRRSAKLVGIGVQQTLFLSFMIAGIIAGIAGVFLSIRQGGADSSTGPSFLFPALTGVFLSATVIHPGRPNVIGAMVGLLFLATVVSGLTFLGATNWAPNLLQGLLLVIAAVLATVLARERGGEGMF